MKVETLVVTTNQTDHSLPERMNLETDAVVGNQCGRDEVEVFVYNGHRVQYVSTATRGVGINRNQILMRAEGDYLVLADDDMTLLNGYESVVCQWFEKLPDADILVFNLEGGKKRHVNTSVCKINRFNYGKYGAARLVLRAGAVRFSGVLFHTMFGGGCAYSCGEDTLFLKECLRAGLRIYGVPDAIASIRDGDSTWFTGYNDKYFFDRGVLYYALNPRTCRLLSLYHCLKHRGRYQAYGWKKAYRQMKKGIESVK